MFKLDGGSVPAGERVDAAGNRPVGLPNPEIIAMAPNSMTSSAWPAIPRGYDSAYPDLWNLSPETDAMFDDIVLGGALAYAGMANYSDHLTQQDTLAIRAYLAHDRLQAGQSLSDTKGMIVPSH